jgi:hypothetical protein
MVCMLASSVVDHWLEHRFRQTKDYNIVICNLSAIKHTPQRSKTCFDQK